ncbi:MAG: hypothetical protein UY16_C0034G0002 [Candidatus Gottesmanbacteria bacterium GW2011_GWA2_47_9]|uniref:Prepilin-type N-terminal cleavage/methylation domain-containing protein n=1 Tax=Candidatus Gottesmanbacteria bacterium GW2011_GWA2_47_9 TaxID=1618445 RepID=A0A0G1TZG0_9BACT|nr:MAG: hypothetical protein UY16_C0034G0002 [Candidatus Gottesmanbacteria bacterium GW2011_GWA2_47_9]
MDFLKHNCNSKSGFSVIEVLVGIFIIILIGLAVYSFQKDIFSLNRTISDSLAAQDETRRALKSMSAEIRTASPSSLGAYALSQTATSSFTFYSNIDDESFKERVRYFTDGSTLKKGVIKPSGTPLTYNPANEVIDKMLLAYRDLFIKNFSFRKRSQRMDDDLGVSFIKSRDESIERSSSSWITSITINIPSLRNTPGLIFISSTWRGSTMAVSDADSSSFNSSAAA